VILVVNFDKKFLDCFVGPKIFLKLFWQSFVAPQIETTETSETRNKKLNESYHFEPFERCEVWKTLQLIIANPQPERIV
jgi:hypothetical protein